MSRAQVEIPARAFPGLSADVSDDCLSRVPSVLRTHGLGARRNSYGLQKISMDVDSPLYSGALSKALSWSAENILTLPESRAEDEKTDDSPQSPSPVSSPGTSSNTPPGSRDPEPGSPAATWASGPGAGAREASSDSEGEPKHKQHKIPSRITFDAQWEQEEKEDVETKAVATSPDGRYLKFNIEIGRGSFKTVYKGLDTETTVEVAWCELQVRVRASGRAVPRLAEATQLIYRRLFCVDLQPGRVGPEELAQVALPAVIPSNLCFHFQTVRPR